jgi:hypothetical protein
MTPQTEGIPFFYDSAKERKNRKIMHLVPKNFEYTAPPFFSMMRTASEPCTIPE